MVPLPSRWQKWHRRGLSTMTSDKSLFRSRCVTWSWQPWWEMIFGLVCNSETHEVGTARLFRWLSIKNCQITKINCFYNESQETRLDNKIKDKSNLYRLTRWSLIMGLQGIPNERSETNHSWKWRFENDSCVFASMQVIIRFGEMV